MRRPCVLVLVLLLLPGCPLFIDPYVWIEPEVDVVEKTLLIVPFSDSKNASFASEDGTYLAQLVIRRIAERSPKTLLADADEVQRLYPGRELEAVGWKTVGRAVGADCVLAGHIESFTLKDPGNANLYVGTIKLRLKVVDTVTGSVVWSSSPPEAVYRWAGPGDPKHGTPVFDISADEVRLSTLKLAARELANVFCRRRLTRAQFQEYQRKRRAEGLQ